ncbi:MAG: hypothetical protein PHN45_10465 [Methylococcales bacterium]|nr:hypothetical protein [Methylococcales bacterium]MDD5755159.1 hypothetical protein [Methylococcales bacterium]
MNHTYPTPNRDAFARLDIPLPENIFAYSSVFVSEIALAQQREIIAAIEYVITLPSYQNYVLSYAPSTAKFVPKARGVFFGYDFHIDENGKSQLIEINTNAGGALLTALQFDIDAQSFVEMFQDEWRITRGSQPLRTIAIVDDTPEQQYLYAEFVLFKQLFEQHGIYVIICAPETLRYHSQQLWYENTPIDLVYNRLTDFSLLEPNQQALVAAYLANKVVITPHPRAHALYADKRNLTVLSNATILETLGVDEKTRHILINGIALTILVEAKNADCLWAGRKQLFFKPTKGYGSKAAYRGDKLTKRVFSEILQHDYVAQTFVPPSLQKVVINNQLETFKFDLRAYVYNGQIQFTCARLYQGQTTNFRTIGGGFAPIVTHF